MPQQQKKWFERTHQGCYYKSLRYFLHFYIGIIENQLLSSNPYWLRLSLRLYSVNKYRIDRKHRWILRLYVRLYFLTFHYCRNNHWCRFLADTNLSALIPEIIGVGFRDYRCWFTTNNWHLWGICEIKKASTAQLIQCIWGVPVASNPNPNLTTHSPSQGWFLYEQQLM